MDIYDEVAKRYHEAKALKAEQQRIQAELSKQGNALTSQDVAAKATATQDRSPDHPEKNDLESEKKHVAEQMTYRPTGMQRPPSPGGLGITYVNPRAYKKPDTQQPENRSAEKPVRQSLFEAAEQRLNEVREAKGYTKERSSNRPSIRMEKELQR